MVLDVKIDQAMAEKNKVKSWECFFETPCSHTHAGGEGVAREENQRTGLLLHTLDAGHEPGGSSLEVSDVTEVEQRDLVRSSARDEALGIHGSLIKRNHEKDARSTDEI